MILSAVTYYLVFGSQHLLWDYLTSRGVFILYFCLTKLNRSSQSYFEMILCLYSCHKLVCWYLSCPFSMNILTKAAYLWYLIFLNCFDSSMCLFSQKCGHQWGISSLRCNCNPTRHFLLLLKMLNISTNTSITKWILGEKFSAAPKGFCGYLHFLYS